MQFAEVNGEEWALVAQQGGSILKLPQERDGTVAKQILDISSLITAGGERGLLGFAPHPDFSANGFVFVHYSRAGDGATVISRFSVDFGTLLAPLLSELKLLVVDQPFTNHKAGSLVFGNDGLLYIPLGDGGSAGDPLGNAQDRSSLLGKILRIDVNHTSALGAYSIPPTNPFARSQLGTRPEIFAIGFRNPFKATVDRITGRIWIGDVGQGLREEIDILRRGRNYGWARIEGDLCYPSGLPCSGREYQAPVVSLPHDDFQSVTGGYVYRGRRFPRLAGSYLYGDFISGRIMRLVPRRGRYENRRLLSSGLNISSFGQDPAGELLVIDYNGGIYSLARSSR